MRYRRYSIWWDTLADFAIEETQVGGRHSIDLVYVAFLVRDMLSAVASGKPIPEATLERLPAELVRQVDDWFETVTPRPVWIGASGKSGSAWWRGLCLRAGCMGNCNSKDCDSEHCGHGEAWWWAVIRGGKDLANNYTDRNHGTSGGDARAKADAAAQRVLKG
jgi:hypothetical protein